MKYFLGIDAGTQSIKGILIDPATGWCSEPVAVHFGRDLPQYGSPDGFLPNPDSRIRRANPLMWLEALDLLLERMRRADLPLSQVDGISGSGQQHGSVYLNERFPETLKALRADLTLAAQLTHAFSRAEAPIWMDASTTAQCEQLRAKFGGAEAIRQRTGSDATERFSGPQIMKFAQDEPEQWAKTATVHLVSSFLASVLAGENMPIDYGDGAGMNLLNLHRLEWDAEIAKFTASGLLNRLPSCVPSTQAPGRLAPYFAKYGLRPGIPVNVWSGDNPNSLIGTGGSLSGRAVVSLGTSDTYFGTIPDLAELPRHGHVFGNPAGGFMTLVCFANGSLTREHFRSHFGLSREEFEREIRQTTPGKYQLLPWLVPEATPPVAHPTLQYNFDPKQATTGEFLRALVESQVLTMRHHAGSRRKPTQIRLTGGAAASPLLRQIVADVFQAAVVIGDTTEAAALGAAMRAANACGGFSFEELTECFCTAQATVEPNPALAGTYDAGLGRFEKLLLQNLH
ncbi:MAG: hypothetical protein II943_10990 [Victivallales bacterium]|nr:hypothetical protein [Victivallales bacterium]